MHNTQLNIINFEKFQNDKAQPSILQLISNYIMAMFQIISTLIKKLKLKIIIRGGILSIPKQEPLFHLTVIAMQAFPRLYVKKDIGR